LIISIHNFGKHLFTTPQLSKKANSQKWLKNLAWQVKERFEEKLVTSSVTGCDQIPDNDIIKLDARGSARFRLIFLGGGTDIQEPSH